MLQTLIRRAAASSMPLPASVTDASVQLIPPIPLYRRLLRIHRSLPPEMRYMGDSYVKSEFRLTRSTDNPLHIIGFLSQWKHYLDDLEAAAQASHPEQGHGDGERGAGTAGDPGSGTDGGNGRHGREIRWSKSIGRRLDTDALDRMSPEQVGQLYELMHATKDVWKTPEQLEDEAEASNARRDGDDTDTASTEDELLDVAAGSSGPRR